MHWNESILWPLLRMGPSFDGFEFSHSILLCGERQEIALLCLPTDAVLEFWMFYKSGRWQTLGSKVMLGAAKWGFKIGPWHCVTDWKRAPTVRAWINSSSEVKPVGTVSVLSKTFQAIGMNWLTICVTSLEWRWNSIKMASYSSTHTCGWGTHVTRDTCGPCPQRDNSCGARHGIVAPRCRCAVLIWDGVPRIDADVCSACVERCMSL
jgi:hypothetical protein